MGDLIEAALPAAPRLEIPVALFTAGHDVFVTCEQQEQFFTQIAAPDKTHFHYPESYHQLLFDLDVDFVVEAAAGWINKHLPER
jgi:alpha-beta hydrolase superfamily lysophospholipase